MGIKMRKMKQSKDKIKEEIKKTKQLYFNHLEEDIKAIESPNGAEDQSYEEVNVGKVHDPDWSYKYSIAEDPR